MDLTVVGLAWRRGKGGKRMTMCFLTSAFDISESAATEGAGYHCEYPRHAHSFCCLFPHSLPPAFPPSLLSKVRVLQDIGEVEFEDGGGVVNLTRGSQHLMQRVYAEQLIRQGKLEQILS